MGKKYSFLVRAVARATQNCKTDKKKLVVSVISLVLTFAVLVTCTFSWYSIETAKVNAGLFSLEAGKGLRVNDSGTTDFQSQENNFDIIPASSVDGRNIFFPTDGTDFSDVTKEITYRSANAGDKNNNYIQIDFKVTAQANNTAIYIDDSLNAQGEPKTSLKVKPHDTADTELSEQLAAPLRMAIWSSAPNVSDNNSAAVPIVFNSQKKTVNTAAVSEVDRASGAYISNAPQVAHQFSDYAIGGTPLAILSAGKETTFSVIIWLEGTDPKCTFSRISAHDIKLKLAFKTSWDKTDTIRLQDNSDGTWVKSKMQEGYRLSVRYTNTDSQETSAFTMYPYGDSGNEWSASVPSDMKNKIEFVLSPGSGTGDVYTFCRYDGDNGNTDTYDRGVNRLYVVQEPASTPKSQCQGHWVPLGDSDGGGVDIGDLDGDDF